VNIRIVLAVLLLAFWAYVSWREFSRGNPVLGGLFAVIGVVLTVWRLRRATS